MYFLLDVCRLCLSYKNEFYDLCSDDIMEKLVACISDLEFEDHVPSVICDKCLEQVDLYYEFRNKCLRSEFIINNYVERLVGGNKTSQLRSKLQVKLAKNYSPTKFPSNVKLPRSTLLADSSMCTNMNKTDLEDSKCDEVHTDITERVKLRKRYRAKRTPNIEIKENTSCVNKSNNLNEIDNIPVHAVQQVNQNVDVNTTEHNKTLLTPENVGINSGLNLALLIPVLTGNNGSAVSSIVDESFKTYTHLPGAQTTFQDKTWYLQSSVNSNNQLKEPLLLSVQPNSLILNILQEDCNKLSVNLDQNQTCSQEVPVTLNRDQIHCKEVPVSLNENVESNMNDNITVINKEPPVYEINDEDDDPPDEINRMMLLESLLSTGPSRIKSRLPALKIPLQSKRKEFTPQLTSNNHISVMEHNYSGQIYLPNQKRFKVTAGPTIDCSSSSSDEIDVEGVSEDEEIKYIDENAIKCMKERNRRTTLRTFLNDLIDVLPSNMQNVRRSRIAALNRTEYYIKSLEKEVLQNVEEVQTLKERNLQLKERLNEIMKKR